MIISKPRSNKTREPAMENDLTSMPSKWRSDSPISEKAIIRVPANSTIGSGFMLAVFCLALMIAGTDPTASITRNSVREIERILLMENIKSDLR